MNDNKDFDANKDRMANLLYKAEYKKGFDCEQVASKHSYLFKISDIQNESDTCHFMESLSTQKTINKNFSHESSLDFNFVKDIRFD